MLQNRCRPLKINEAKILASLMVSENVRVIVWYCIVNDVFKQRLELSLRLQL